MKKTILISITLLGSLLAFILSFYIFFQQEDLLWQQSIETLYSPSFENKVQVDDAGSTLALLRNEEVISKKGFIKSGVIDQAKSISSNSSIGEYTEALLSIAVLLKETEILLLDGLDLKGGDYRSTKVKDEKECLEICLKEEKCSAYTYAKATHPNPKKHKSCFLKSGNTRISVDHHYISGIK